MPAKKRLVKVREHRITPEAIAAFRAGDSLALHRALGLRPWQISPLDVEAGEPCVYPAGSGGAMSWPLALELRAELLEAVPASSSEAPQDGAPRPF